MLLIKTVVKDSTIEGLGCYTEETIKKGQCVWEIDQRIDTIIPVDSLSQLPESVRDFLQRYAYLECVNNIEQLVLCGDNSRHMNHAEQPNLIESHDGRDIAKRDIEIGEELTVNYFDFDLNAEEKLKSYPNIV